MRFNHQQTISDLAKRINSLESKIKKDFSVKNLQHIDNKVASKIKKVNSKFEHGADRIKINVQTTAHSPRTFTAESFRVKYENLILFISLIPIIIFFFIISFSSLLIFPILIVCSALVLKTKQGQLLGQAVKVSQNQFSDIYEAGKIASERLQMKMPDIFVVQNPVINAYAIGFLGKKSVVLHSKTVEAMNQTELISILGHEFAHIHCNHTKWMVITSSTEAVRIPILSSLFGFMLLFWSRKAEFTADRGGLLASKDLNSSISALAKVAVGDDLFKKLNIDLMVDQMNSADLVDKLSETFGTHPYMVNRIKNLKEFSRSNIYSKLASFTST